MATRDVELVVKARNEATNAIEKVDGALAHLTKTQRETAEGAAHLGNTQDKLKRDLDALTNQGAVIKALQVVADQLEKAEKSAARTTAILPKLREEESALSKNAQEAAQAHAELAAKLAAAQAALAAEGNALKTAKGNLKDYVKEARDAKAAKEALDKARFFRDPNTGLFGSLPKAREQAAADHAAALARIEGEKAAILRLTEAKKQSGSAFKVAAAEEMAAAKTATAFASQAASKTRSREFAEAKAAQATGALQELRQAGEAAAAVIGGVALKQDALAAASARAAALVKQTAAALEAERAAALQTPSTAPRGRRTLADYRAEREGLAGAQGGLVDARSDMAAKRAEATRLGRELAGAAVPTAEMVAEFNLARKAADDATQAYYRQAEAVRKLSEAERARLEAARARVAADRGIEAARAAGQPMFTPLASEWKAAAPGPQMDSHVAAMRKYRDEQVRVADLQDRVRASLGNVREAFTSHDSALTSATKTALGLAAAYVGLHAAAQQLHQVIETIRVTDAAANRLGVVFEGDSARTGQEIVYLQTQADRLGISFGMLLDQYARVSLAAKEVGGTTEQTRKIFMAFSETGRVAKLSTNEMQRMFLAIDEMMSRGKIQAKELRQLSYTIAGAPEIIAKALFPEAKNPLAKLTEAMKGGEVEANMDNMLKIAEGLQSRYGVQLPEALKTTTTEIGRLSNTAFRLRESFAEGGFSDGLRIALHALNEELSKPEALAGMRELGASAGRAVQIIVPLVKHIGDLAAVIGILAGAWATLKLGTFIASAGRATMAIIAFTQAVRAAGVATAAAGLFAAGSNPVGLTLLAIAGAAAGAYWAYNKFVDGTKVAPEVDALARHREHLVELQRVYEDNGKSLDGWKEKIKNVDLAALDKSFEEMKRMFETKSRDFRNITFNPFSARVMANQAGFSEAETSKITQLLADFKDGKTTVEQFAVALAEMQRVASGPQARKSLAEFVLEVGKLAQAEDAFKKSARLAVEFGSANDEAREAAEKYGITLKEIVEPHDAVAEAAEAAKKKAENYEKAMEALDETIKKATKGHADLDAILESVANKYKAVANAAGDTKEAVEKGDKAITELLRKYYGYKAPEANKDAAALDALTKGGKMSKEEAQGRIDAVKAEVKAQKDAEEAKDKAEKTAKAQKDFDTRADIDAGKKERDAEAERKVAMAQRALEEAKKTGRGVNEAQGLVNSLQRSQFIDKAEGSLRDRADGKEGVKVTDDQVKRVREMAAAEWDSKHANDAIEQSKARLQEAETRLSNLLERRKALEEAISYSVEHPGSASPETQAQLRLELRNVKLQAGDAADEAERLARALGDRKAVDNIRNQRNSLRDVKDSFITVKEVATTFGNNLTSAIDKSADALGKALNGTQKWSNAWKEVRNNFLNFAADFMKQIGQMLVKKAIFGALGLDDTKKNGKAGIEGQGGLLGMLSGGGSTGNVPFYASANGKSTTGFVNAGVGSLTGGGILGSLGGSMSRNVTSSDGLYSPMAKKAGEFSASDAAALIKKVGGTDEEAKTLAAIAMAESSGKPGAHNTNRKTGDNSYGLWQINMLDKMGPERLAKYGLKSNDELFDPETNARVALKMARDRGSYKDWSTYNKGLHKKYMAGIDMEPTGTIKPMPSDFLKPTGPLGDKSYPDREMKQAAAIAKRDAANNVAANDAAAAAPGADRVPADIALEEARKEAARVAARDAVPEPAVDGREMKIAMERQRKDAEDAARKLAEAKDVPLPPPRPADLGSLSKATPSAVDAPAGGMFGGGLSSMLPFAGAGLSALMMILGRKKKLSPALQMAPMVLGLLPKLLGLFGGGGGSLFAGILHSGGMATDGATRQVSASLFSDALRLHDGGIAGGGLKANEVPRILDKSEEVLTRSDARHAMNGGKTVGGAPQKPMSVKVVNTIDPGEFVSNGLDTTHGEQAVMNFFRANSAAIKGILG